MFAKVEAQGHKFLSAIKEEVQVSRKSACGSVALEVLSFEEERSMDRRFLTRLTAASAFGLFRPYDLEPSPVRQLATLRGRTSPE